jgi:hypothetical protein
MFFWYNPDYKFGLKLPLIRLRKTVNRVGGNRQYKLVLYKFIETNFPTFFFNLSDICAAFEVAKNTKSMMPALPGN